MTLVRPGGWYPLLDVDFRTLGSMTLSSDINYSIGGFLFRKRNSANEIVAASINSSGLTFQPDSTSNYFSSVRTAPNVHCHFQDISIRRIEYATRFRLMAYVSASNHTANFDNALIGVDWQTLTTNTYSQILQRGFGTAPLVGFQELYIVNNGEQMGNDTAATINNTTNNVMVVEACAGITEYLAYYGTYTNNDFPKDNELISLPSKSLVGVNAYTDPVYIRGITLGAQRAGSGTALSVTFARVRLEAKF